MIEWTYQMYDGPVWRCTYDNVDYVFHPDSTWSMTWIEDKPYRCRVSADITDDMLPDEVWASHCGRLLGA